MFGRFFQDLVGAVSRFNTLPVQGYCLHRDDGGNLKPALMVDASGRPDVTDLSRVLYMEGDLRYQLRWAFWPMDTPKDVYLMVKVQSPVRTEFAVRLDAANPVHHAALTLIQRTGEIDVAFLPEGRWVNDGGIFAFHTFPVLDMANLETALARLEG